MPSTLLAVCVFCSWLRLLSCHIRFLFVYLFSCFFTQTGASPSFQSDSRGREVQERVFQRYDTLVFFCCVIVPCVTPLPIIGLAPLLPVSMQEIEHTSPICATQEAWLCH